MGSSGILDKPLRRVIASQDYSWQQFVEIGVHRLVVALRLIVQGVLSRQQRSCYFGLKVVLLISTFDRKIYSWLEMCLQH